MNIVCLDLEGVLVPEIWIAFAKASNIPELKRTTRDEPDYDIVLNSVKHSSTVYPMHVHMAAETLLSTTMFWISTA